MQAKIDLSKYINLLEDINPIRLCGKVSEVIGLVVESVGPSVSIGDFCYIKNYRENVSVRAEVVGFRKDKVLLMPFGLMRGIAAGSQVVSSGRPLTVGVGMGLLGRIIDGLGRPQDGRGQIFCHTQAAVYGKAQNPLKRKRIRSPLPTGVKAIDALLSCGMGQRIGIFSGSGVGKSKLLGMIARYSEADVVVVGLIGERGREVRDFIEENLGIEGLRKSVVIAATSDQPALVRINGAFIAATIAEYYRDCGKKVLLVMDSVTRLAMAQREVGLAIGEPPTTRGYTPSVFSLLPKLLERSGTSETGTITGVYTVLVEADDLNEPIADAVRSILDGHIVLSRDLADSGHYPPIDVLASVSRLMPDIVSKQHFNLALQVREMLAEYKKAGDLINIGAYKEGSNPKIDRAKKMINQINDFLKQPVEQKVDYQESIALMEKIMQ
ncbi:MAG: flagellar protein export ATPase FliI [Candidatus Omnitrophota bacterium]|nr:MAG: flagellar protein export ATPase FliI [Candidatus Omnitrophota bacterium]